jgi:hypothetical protein
MIRADKAGGLTRKMGWLIDMPTLTANIFAVATNSTNTTKPIGSQSASMKRTINLIYFNPIYGDGQSSRE